MSILFTIYRFGQIFPHFSKAEPVTFILYTILSLHCSKIMFTLDNGLGVIVMVFNATFNNFQLYSGGQFYW